MKSKGQPELSDEAEALVNSVWDPKISPDTKCQGPKAANLTHRDLNTLKPDGWLNDEVVNHYMQMIGERSLHPPNPSNATPLATRSASASKSTRGSAQQQPGTTLPRVYIFNTFFFQRYDQCDYNYGDMRKWTNRVDLFSYDILMVPIHQYDAHWALVVVDLTQKRVDFYDSFNSNGFKIMQRIKEYLAMEAISKMSEKFDEVDSLVLHSREDIPLQQNSSDCGVFMCQYAEYASRRVPINFAQSNMAYFRKRMVWEICTGKLMFSD